MSNAATTVDEASKWADALLQRAYRGPGDTIEAASYRAEQKYGVPAQTFWALRYRRPNGILAHIYLRLKAAYEAECGRQEARLRHELELVKALPRNEARQVLIDETEAALGIAPSKTGTEG
ncbi:MAG: hypothetical protein ACTHN2_21240 [Nitrobacter sp.]